MTHHAHLLILALLAFPAAAAIETAWVLAFGGRRVATVALAMASANALVGCGAMCAYIILDPPLLADVFRELFSAEHILPFATWAPRTVAAVAVASGVLVKLPFYGAVVPPRSRSWRILLSTCVVFQTAGVAGVSAGFESGVGTHLAELTIVDPDELGVTPRDGLGLCDAHPLASLEGPLEPRAEDELDRYWFTVGASASEGLIVRFEDGGFQRYHLDGPLFRIPIAFAQPHHGTILLLRVANSVLALALDTDRVAFVAACDEDVDTRMKNDPARGADEHGRGSHTGTAPPGFRT